MKPGQTFMVYQGKCPVDKNPKGNTKIGSVDLVSSAGDKGLTDRCASVHTFGLVNQCLPDGSSLLCNVRPKCMLQDDRVQCKNCDEARCSNILVEHIQVST